MKKLTLVIILFFTLHSFAKEKTKAETKEKNTRKPNAESTFEWQETFNCTVSQIVADKNTATDPKYSISLVGVTPIQTTSIPDGTNFKNLKSGRGTIQINNELSLQLQINLSQHQDNLMSIVGKPDLLQAYTALIQKKQSKVRVITRIQNTVFGDSATGGSFSVNLNLVNPDILSIALKEGLNIFPAAGDGFDLAPVSSLITKNKITDKSLLAIQINCSTTSTKPQGGFGF